MFRFILMQWITLRLQDNNDTRRRREAACALARLGDRRAVEPFVSALEDKDLTVQRTSAEALGELGDRRAVEPLIRSLEDKYVRQAAVEALGKLGDRRAVEPLISALENEYSYGRYSSAADALGELGDRRAVEPLIRALEDKDKRVRQTAVEALGKLGDRRAVESLIRALEDKDVSVRHRAAEALGELGDARALEPLVTLLDYDGKTGKAGTIDVRKAALSSLSRLAAAQPTAILPFWDQISQLARSPEIHEHRDCSQLSDCVHTDRHTDSGIGLPWPDTPPRSAVEAAGDLHFVCPNAACGRKLTVPFKFAGKTGKCPSCGARLDVPTGTAGQNASDQLLEF